MASQRADAEGFECSRCGDDVPVDDAIMLSQKDSKSLWKYLCPDCLEETGVPRGYEIDRDLAYLRGGAAARSEDATERSSSVIADFAGQVVSEEMAGDELTPGRVVMNRKQLVLATEDHRTVVRLTAIHDVGVGRVSTETTDYFDDVVSIGYRRRGADRVAFVGGTRDVIDRFTTVLFKALLSGTTVRFKHPSVVGGRVYDTAVRTGELRVGEGAVRVRGPEPPLSIELAGVTELTKRRRRWGDGDGEGEGDGDGDMPALAVRHLRGDREVVTEFAVPSERRTSVLARYLQLDHRDRKADVRDLDLSGDELRGLAALYSCSRGADLSTVLGAEPARVERLLDGLESKGLVARDGGGRRVTLTGRCAVHHRFDEIEG